MRDDMKLENYYSRNAWDYDRVLQRAYEVLSSYDDHYPPTDVSHILELYNLHQLLEGNARQEHLKNFDTSNFKTLSKLFMTAVVEFFKQITEDNIQTYADDCYIYFADDFWELIDKFEVYKRIERFPWVAEKCSLPLYRMLQYKRMVQYLDEELSQYMRESDQTAELLINHYLSKHDTKDELFFPSAFTTEDKKTVIRSYICSEYVSPQALILISEAPKNKKECPIDDRMKIDAEKRIKDISEGKSKHIIVSNTMGQEIIVSFAKDMADPVECFVSSRRVEMKFSVGWIEGNQDYPTLLNNFIYLFNFVDMEMRWQFTEKASSRGTIEDAFLVKGVNSYIFGKTFRTMDWISSTLMGGYYQRLIKIGVPLEDIIKWFFEVYLRDEFNADGFICNMPKATDNYLTKCKLLVSAMDGVAKQFRMFLENGDIDRELYERTSEHIRYDRLGSFSKCKYIYCNSKLLAEAQALLFSHQSHMNCTDKTGSQYDTFYKLLKTEQMKPEDFYDFQKPLLEQLMASNILSIEDDYLEFNTEIVRLLHEFYYQGVVCYCYSKNDILDRWIKDKDVEIGNTLFSKGESDYINYYLNQAEFSNGLDLRNKYAHDTCSTDEKVQENDYYQLLKIMVLLVIKINEEFCLKDECIQFPFASS